MIPSVQESPATTATTASRGVAPAPLRASAVPRGVTNAPQASGRVWMEGMPCYGEHAPPGIGGVLTAGERAIIAGHYSRHRGYLNNPDYLINVEQDPAQVHAAYRVLCTQFVRPGDFAIRHAEQGDFMLLHRSRRTPQLLRSALEYSAKGWQLEVAGGPRDAWAGVRGRHFATLDALKAALPAGMHEIAAASLGEFEITHL